MEIIGVIIAGIIIGLLGKFVAPGDKDNIPIWLTILCGIGGVILGWFVYSAFGGNGKRRHRLGPLDRGHPGRRRARGHRVHHDRQEHLQARVNARPNREPRPPVGRGSRRVRAPSRSPSGTA